MEMREKVFYLITGVRLHLKEYFLKITGREKRYKYCISFPSIPEGLKAEKFLKGIRAVSIPIPNEIFEGCGVGILVVEEDLNKLLKRLKENGVMVSGIFKREEKNFIEVKR